MSNNELLELESKINNLEQELSKLKDTRRQLKRNITYLVGCCLNRSNYYYKVLSVNTANQTAEALCVTYKEDGEYGIILLPELSFEYVNSLALMSLSLFEKLHKEVMNKIFNI